MSCKHTLVWKSTAWTLNTWQECLDMPKLDSGLVVKPGNDSSIYGHMWALHCMMWQAVTNENSRHAVGNMLRL